jgi:carbon-monoxide dehydrogenase small subunit
MAAQRIISFALNGARVTASVEPHINLIELLQVQFGLVGAREACGQGLCGCCTVLVNGIAVSGCLYLASFVDGADVITIEGFDVANQLTPVQEAFIETGAFQCGYCTSGFIVMATQLLDKYPEPTDSQIKHYLSGNLCRCAAYPEIIEAVKLAARKRKAQGPVAMARLIPPSAAI